MFPAIGQSSALNMHCIVSNVVSSVELESELDLYKLSLSIDHFNVRFNEKDVFRSGVSNEHILDSPVHYSSALNKDTCGVWY